MNFFIKVSRCSKALGSIGEKMQKLSLLLYGQVRIKGSWKIIHQAATPATFQ